jgi:LuxR family maltose regulon positive regulatory protein
LRHSATAQQVIEAAAEHRSDAHGSHGRRRLFQTVDEMVSEQVSLLAARAQIRLGRPHEAQIILEARYGSVDAGAARQPATLAMLACRQGRLSDAVRHASEALQGVEGHDAGVEPTELEARLVLAEVFYERNQLEAAQEQLEAAFRWCYFSGVTPWMVAAKTYLARLSVARGRIAEAAVSLEHLGQVRDAAVLTPFLTRTLNQVEIDCRLQLGDVQGASGLMKAARPDDCDCETSARFELCCGRPDRAVALLSTGTDPIPARQIRRLVLLAWARLQQGRTERAGDIVRQALKAAERERYIRPFLELAPHILPLVCAVGASPTDPYVSQLTSQAGRTSSEAISCENAAVLEPLTDREWQVLQHLPSHRSTRQIADLMCVSTNTVKTHMKNIYRKIGANSRDNAVAVARQHGIISGPRS